MQTYLVTGAAGFIGSEFVRQLIAETDVRVVALDRLSYAGNLDNLASVADHPHFTFEQGDIADRRLVQRLLGQHRCTAIVNLAAESHVDRSIGQPAEFVRTNVVGTFELLETALAYWDQLDVEGRSAFRFLHVSTDEVFGSLGDEGKFVETSPYDPSSPYSASKAASDHFVRAYYRTYGLPSLIVNCSNNYGPFQFPEKLVPLMIRKALAGEPLPIYGQGNNVRDWLHVSDNARALRLVIDRGTVGASYNIGGAAECSNLNLVKLICQTIDDLCPQLPQRPCAQLISHVADRPGHDYRYAIDCRKIQVELGWGPQVAFDAGMRQTIEWYIANAAWVERTLERADYQGERLGLTHEVGLAKPRSSS